MLFKSIIQNLRIRIPQSKNICTSTTVCATSGKYNGCEHWKSYNEKVFPPQTLDEPRRHAYVCHVKENVKYSYKKLWYIACFIRGMTIENALKQLQFVNKKGAVIVSGALLEAQEMAVKDHNVEFKSNLWVAESFSTKGVHFKGMRRHAKGRRGEIRYGYAHYYVTLEEGQPPEHYYEHHRPKTSEELLNDWLTLVRRRKISSSL